MIAISHAPESVFLPLLGLYLEPEVPAEISESDAEALAGHPYISVSPSTTAVPQTPVAAPPVVEPVQSAPVPPVITQEAING